MANPTDGAEFLGNVLETLTLQTDQGEVTFEGRDYGTVFKTPGYPTLGWNWGHVQATDEPDVIKFAGKFFRAIPDQ